MMDTGQVNTWDYHWMATNYISLMLIKGTTLKAMCSLPLSNPGQAYILKHFLPTHLPCMWSGKSYAVGATNLVYRSENTWFVILHEEQLSAFQEVNFPKVSGAYRLEAFFAL